MYPKNFQNLIDHFASLQGVGPKMAERLVLGLFKKNIDVAESFAHALTNLHDVKTCTRCFNISQDDLCHICLDNNRTTTLLCVVEEPLDIIPIERSRAFDGLYHVLGGTVSGKKSDHLNLPSLQSRIAHDGVTEVIIATNFTTEGDTTALFLQRFLGEHELTVTRLVRGLATGSDIEYADDLTLKSALTNRTKL